MASANSYLVGMLVNLKAVFTDSDGNPVDPDTVVCKVRVPTVSDLALLTIIKDSVGVYQSNYSLVDAIPGTYLYRWEGTGTVQAAGEGSFRVVKSKVIL